MPMYIALINWTEQGVRNVTESPRRAQAFREMATQMGCTVHGVFYTMGRYDIAVRLEAPDDETMSAVVLKVAQLGNVRSETMRAYSEEEFGRIAAKVSG
jgi:uncharacterized protein with GYD domain